MIGSHDGYRDSFGKPTRCFDESQACASGVNQRGIEHGLLNRLMIGLHVKYADFDAGVA